MSWRVRLVVDAEDDLVDIHRYVAQHDSPEAADRLLDKLLDGCASLSDLPERGHIPIELSRVDVSTYREIRLKPYRIIYQIEPRTVFVHAVLDGRRSLQDLLQRRLLR